MIKLVFGNVGSGKTASMVRYMRDNPHKNFITNIDVSGKDFKHVLKLKANMIIKKEVIGLKRDGTENFKLKLNVEFWKNLILEKKHIDIIIDEAHIFFNPRRSMSKINMIATDFLALLRRVLGSADNSGNLILVTQLSRRLDIISKEMATEISYVIHHYITQCSGCGVRWEESNETADKFNICPKCRSYRIKRIKSVIEVIDFQNVDKFEQYKEYGIKSYYKRYLIKDISSIFGNYNTLQFDDMLSEL